MTNKFLCDDREECIVGELNIRLSIGTCNTGFYLTYSNVSSSVVFLKYVLSQALRSTGISELKNASDTTLGVSAMDICTLAPSN